MSPIESREYRIDTPRGQLFAKRWTPAAAGSALPIVLLHESLGCVALWRDFPERLAAASRRPVVAYDRLGFGLSPAHPDALPLDFIEDEARRDFPVVLRQLGIERFIAFGHSVGGSMAVACAAAWPQACQALVVEAALTFVEPLTLDGIRAADRVFARDGQLQRLERYHGEKARWVLRSWVDTWLSEDFTDWNLDADLARVRCPILSLHGELDEYGSQRHPQRLARLAGGPATLRPLPGCGHVPHRQQPEAVLDAVVAFLRGHD
ncbi:alpha/beta hydrolase [Pseudomonas aeruginosa]|uniref:alpha/beta fold hydrolase n=2 Tax=Pseudomonas aeruginosa TaxID=287 RepID=UPI00053F0718|nr:alpha/beta hydrolase [Pseudomonas aeruginosa]KSD27529.1 alpha/beta hydrolase [Pseudomonas aeruginosa]KSL70050.1 alpha/beta hydrolase [Pseudomonas aeruginosa]KSM85211.1 alpha/beta hydrolase [Pseudomonas aeruginosa]KSQ00649.1 alpha/beta hydrolase [Pseudomonas aeruginosa]MCD2753552.1 alpha/beta hydrolase [Pseudomonas aeruginosa]